MRNNTLNFNDFSMFLKATEKLFHIIFPIRIIGNIIIRNTFYFY